MLGRRRWCIVPAGHSPVITNGWTVAEVAADERRWMWRYRLRVRARR